jgi:hypothetical protein
MMFKIIIDYVPTPPFSWFAELNDSKVGWHLEKGWCMELHGNVIFFESEESCMVLLPILEFKRAAFFNALNAVKNCDACAINERFPEKLLLLFAFKYSLSDYWVELAYEWLLESKDTLNEIKVDLEKLVDKKAFSQKMGHKIRRLIRQDNEK